MIVRATLQVILHKIKKMPAVLPDNVKPDLRSSSLAAKEPYHIPGYAGYRPQFKFQCSETHGACTNRLLTSTDVQKSGNSVLSSINPPRSKTARDRGYHDIPQREDEFFDINTILQSRRGGKADTLYKPQMRSGYAGFVPKAHFSSYFAKPFSDICDSALKDFTVDQQSHKRGLRTLSRSMNLQEATNLTQSEREAIGTRHRLPLRPQTNNSVLKNYKSPSYPELHDSPYFLPSAHPQKYFKSGFAGHVPFYKDVGGHGFPIVTRQALDSFTNERGRVTQSLNTELSSRTIKQPKSTKQRVSFTNPNMSHQVYLVDAGLIPRYAGYVPGLKFRHGKRYTELTANPTHLQSKEPIPAL